MQLRQYQREAVDAIYRYFQHHSGNPLIVMPTGSGKSFVMAAFIQEVLSAWSNQRILVLTHVKELIEQNYAELVDHWPLAPAGVYSAGLKRREADAQILFGGIQSVYTRAKEISECDLVLIDECHLVPRSSDTMYRRFLDDMLKINKELKIIGLTATHYRLDSGLLTEGENRVFTDVAYEVPVRRLINEGWLSPLITKAPAMRLDVSGVHTRGGEFIPGELAVAVDRTDVNENAVREMLHYGRDRKSWLVFCSGVDHAYHVREVLRGHGISTETLTGETNALERDYILGEFKAGRIRAVTNCDLLTTGFNHPGTDLLAILRPTQSTGLYVQIAGRGMRNAPGKENCLILDFAGNIERHGPIDRVNPYDPSHNGNGKAPVKTCPQCRSVIYAGFRHCPDCNHEFPPPESEIKPSASSKSIISHGEAFWVEVERIRYARHTKIGKPDSLRVDYYESSFSWYSEWVCLEHGGFAARRARRWWKRHGGDPTVMTIGEALLAAAELKQPSHVFVQEDGKYWRIVRYRFDGDAEVPVEVEGDWGEDENAIQIEEEAPF